MKKKIALLLAAVMAVAVAMPSNLFAGSKNSLSTTNYAAPGNTIFPDASLAGVEVGEDTDQFKYVDADYVGKGVNLVLTLEDLPQTGANNDGSFRLKLTNAEFAFYTTDLESVPATTSPFYGQLVTMLSNFRSAFAAITLTPGTAVTPAIQEKYLEIAEALVDIYGLFADDGAIRESLQDLYDELDALTLDALDPDDAKLIALMDAADAAITEIDSIYGAIDLKIDELEALIDNGDVAGTATSGEFTDWTDYQTVVEPIRDALSDDATGSLKALFDTLKTAADAATTLVPDTSPEATFDLTKYVPTNIADADAGFGYIKEDGYYKVLRLESPATTGYAYYTLSITDGMDDEAVIEYKNARDGNRIVIPLVTLSDDDEDCKVEILDTTGSNVTPGEYVYNLYGGGVTNTVAKSIKESRDKFTLDDIIVSERRIGVIKPNGWFSITAPDEYSIEIGDIQVSASNTGKVAIETVYEKLDSEDSAYHSTVFIKLKAADAVTDGYKLSTTITNNLVISGLKLTAKEDDTAFGDVSLTIAGEVLSFEAMGHTDDIEEDATNKDSMITEQTFKVAKRIDYAVTVSAASAKEFYSGFTGKEAAKISVKELLEKTWLMERDTIFKLVDAEGKDIDAKFSKVKFTEVKNFSNVKKDAEYKWANENAKYDGTSTPDAPSGTITFKDNTLTLKGFTQDASKAASFDMVPYISVAAGYAGDVYVLPVLKGVDTEYEPILIAKVKCPVEVSTKSTNVQIGYSVYPVADVTITEAAKGALAKGESIYLATTSSALSDTGMSFNNITLANNVVVDEASGLTLKIEGSHSKGTMLEFVVTKESSAPATILFKGLALYINRSVPYGDYYLVVGGTTVAKNYDVDSDTHSVKQMFDKFDIEGIYVDKFVTVATPGENLGATRNVKITENSNIAIVNGVEEELPVPTILDGGSFLVPLRFITIALGIPEANIHWDPIEGTATIITANRNVVFKEGSAVMTIGGSPINMVDAEGNLVVAKIVGDRMYVPFRKLGEAFGVEVVWHEDTKIAEYNPQI